MGLTYKLKVSGQESEFQAKLWYDPKTFQLVKRVIAVKMKETEGTFTETYDEVVLGADIPDEKFKLPAEK